MSDPRCSTWWRLSAGSCFLHITTQWLGRGRRPKKPKTEALLRLRAPKLHGLLDSARGMGRSLPSRGTVLPAFHTPWLVYRVHRLPVARFCCFRFLLSASTSLYPFVVPRHREVMDTLQQKLEKLKAGFIRTWAFEDLMVRREPKQVVCVYIYIYSKCIYIYIHTHVHVHPVYVLYIDAYMHAYVHYIRMYHVESM